MKLRSTRKFPFHLFITCCTTHLEFPLLSISNSYLFSLITRSVSILWNKLDVTPTYWLSGSNFITDTRSWCLHPKISVITISPGSDRNGISHDTSQLQSWLLQRYLTYIPEHRNVQTKTQSSRSIHPLFIWVLMSLHQRGKCTTVEVYGKIYLQ